VSNAPNRSRLEIHRGTREHGSGHALAGLAAVHDALGDGGEVAGPVVDGDVVVWLVPHPLRRALLTGLGRVAGKFDGGRILGAGRVLVRIRLVGGIRADVDDGGPGGRW
jgi:hypothetical protein